MNSRLTLAGIGLLAAFGLAACGGGSTAKAPDPAPTTPTTPAPPAGPTAERIKADAADAITAAVDAGMDAEQAKKDAIKFAGMLTTKAVDGNSATAAANAQKVLDAETAAKAAVTDADAALTAAMAAKTAAEALPETDAGRVGAIAAADEAVRQATAQKKAARAIVDATGTGSLKEAAEKVRGSNPLAEGYPKTPADHGEDVAENVKTALGTAVDPAVANATEGAIRHDGDAIGAKTWARIVGEDKVMDVRRLVSGNISQVKAMSVMGSMADDLKAADATLPEDQNEDKDGIQNNDGANFGAMYKGIAGTVFCAGSDCGRSAGGTLTGSWYFTPADGKELYVSAQAGGYKVATMYARYGAWLTYANDAATSATGVSRYAAKGHADTNTANLDLGQAGTPPADVTAGYSGKAAGISVRNKASGRFTADVNLTATFGTAPNLRGRIHSFAGDAVGNWIVTLNQTNLDATNANFTDGTTAGGGAAGAWTAQGYGPTPSAGPDGIAGNSDDVNQRPAGFFGTFNANFGDGMAVGGYATRKD